MPQETRQQHEERMDRIRERILHGELSVSGGKDNPPDRYDAVQITGHVATDLSAINALADQGYRFVAVVSNFVLMGNYNK